MTELLLEVIVDQSLEGDNKVFFQVLPYVSVPITETGIGEALSYLKTKLLATVKLMKGQAQNLDLLSLLFETVYNLTLIGSWDLSPDVPKEISNLVNIYLVENKKRYYMNIKLDTIPHIP